MCVWRKCKALKLRLQNSILLPKVWNAFLWSVTILYGIEDGFFMENTVKNDHASSSVHVHSYMPIVVSHTLDHFDCCSKHGAVVWIPASLASIDVLRCQSIRGFLTVALHDKYQTAPSCYGYHKLCSVLKNIYLLFTNESWNISENARRIWIENNFFL